MVAGYSGWQLSKLNHGYEVADVHETLENLHIAYAGQALSIEDVDGYSSEFPN